MRRWTPSLVTAGLAVLLVAPAAAAAGQGGDDSLTLYTTEASNVTITRTGEVLEGEAAESGPPSVGDRFLVLDTVYSDADRTQEVGLNHIQCTVTEASGEFPETEPVEGDPLPEFAVSFVCSGVLDLGDGGTLTWSGVSGFSSEDGFEEATDEPFIVLAITGGTGDLIGASGEVAAFDESTEMEGEVLSRYEVTLLGADDGRGKGKRK